MPIRQQRLVRRVANDAFVDLDTVRYSVPHRLVRERVEVALGESEVRIFHGTELVAVHHRSFEPHDRVRDPSHFKGLWRDASAIVADAAPTSGLPAYGRSLRDYEAVLTAEVGR